MRPSSGFTLIEVLVVVVIIAVLVGAAMMSLNLDPQRDGEDEAQKLAALIRLASQEAVIRGRELAVEIKPDSYRFLILENKQWVALEDNVLRTTTLPDGMRFDIQAESGRLGNKADGEQDAVQVFLLSSGEMTPFKLTLRVDESIKVYQLTGGVGGQLILANQ